MRTIIFGLLVWLFGVALPLGARAQVVHIQVVKYDDHSLCFGGDEINADYPASSPINLLGLSSCAQYVYITAGSSVNMPRITITGGITSLPFEISLGFFVDQSGSNPTSVGHDWAGLDCSGASATAVFYGGIGGNLTDSIVVPHLFVLTLMEVSMRP